MKSLLHSLIALLVAVWLAVPSPGGEGGENAGGTGVWILPFSANVNQEPENGPLPSQARMSIVVSDLARDLRLQSSDELGQSVAMCVDQATGMPVLLPVVGCHVTVPAALLRSLSLTRTNADIVISDAFGNGYRISVRVEQASGAVCLLVH